MTENVELTICGVKGGEVYYGQTINWTVRQSIVSKLDSWYPTYDTDVAMKQRCDLLASMLIYGDEAQKLFNSENTNLPTAGLDKYQTLIDNINAKTPEMGTYPALDETGMKATVSTFGMMLQEKVKLYGNFKIKSANFTQLEDYRVEIQHVKGDGTVLPYTINSDALTVSGNSTKYIMFTFDKLAANNLRDDLVITLYQGEEAVSVTVTRSADMIASTLLGSYPTLIPAIMNYADCAKVYFG